MNAPISKARRSDDFDELLWQITGELALTPASASLAAAPFIDVEPEPEPETARSTPETQSELARAPARASAPRIPHFIMATAAAVILAFGAFAAGQTSNEPAIVTAMELPRASEEGAVMAVAFGPSTQIPAADPAPESASVEPEPEPEPEPKAKPRAKRKSKAKAKPKPKYVPFEDL